MATLMKSAAFKHAYYLSLRHYRSGGRRLEAPAERVSPVKTRNPMRVMFWLARILAIAAASGAAAVGSEAPAVNQLPPELSARRDAREWAMEAYKAGLHADARRHIVEIVTIQKGRGVGRSRAEQASAAKELTIVSVGLSNDSEPQAAAQAARDSVDEALKSQDVDSKVEDLIAASRVALELAGDEKLADSAVWEAARLKPEHSEVQAGLRRIEQRKELRERLAAENEKLREAQKAQKR